MTFGLQIYNPQAALVFDSDTALGGTFSGLYTIPASDGSLHALELPGLTSTNVRVLPVYGRGAIVDHMDLDLGYLRIWFHTLSTPIAVALFLL